jgi:hypothetical protein
MPNDGQTLLKLLFVLQRFLSIKNAAWTYKFLFLMACRDSVDRSTRGTRKKNENEKEMCWSTVVGILRCGAGVFIVQYFLATRRRGMLILLTVQLFLRRKYEILSCITKWYSLYR